MTFKQVHFIINPSSGKDEPILSYINSAFLDSGIDWDISVTKKEKTARDIARTLIGKTDLVVVYGGDGSITEVASALHGTNMPMAIVPGGTANVLAKELGIPIESVAALEMIHSHNHQVKVVDMGMVNNHPFILRVNLGIMAEMVLQANRNLKDSFGQLAYGVTAIKTVANSKLVKYKLEIDDAIIEKEGVSLTVTNSGNIGIGDFTLQPGISITDGLLDIILLKNADFTSLIKAAGSTLLQYETDAIEHWKCKQVIISMDSEDAFLCDDCQEFANRLMIKVVPKSINILVPAEG